MIRTNNPALTASTFGGADFSPVTTQGLRAGAMTLQGTVNKTFILLCLCAASAIFAWANIIPARAVVDGAIDPGAIGNWGLWAMGGGFGGFILALALIFNPRWAPFLAPVYALLEGCFVGGISAAYAMFSSGKVVAGGLALNYAIIIQAGLLTFGILAALLIAYTSRIIKPSENFKLAIVAATGGICLVFVATMILQLFGVQVPYLYDGGPIAIGFAGFVVVIASLNLVLDFDFIEEGVQRGAPKHMEWYAGFGLLVTLVWLYVSILRLLAMLGRRD
ncbi:MAG: Bax inhibitor-1/YccA family protein [Phycisphaeraceae bacterium]|nr:Bax inhibitor-1/YccA family protein [Phycisphaeraceae bacterium]